MCKFTPVERPRNNFCLRWIDFKNYPSDIKIFIRKSADGYLWYKKKHSGFMMGAVSMSEYARAAQLVENLHSDIESIITREIMLGNGMKDIIIHIKIKRVGNMPEVLLKYKIVKSADL